MPLNFAMSALCVLEFLLWAVVTFLFWKKGFHRSFPAMGNYLVLHMATQPVILALILVKAPLPGYINFWGPYTFALIYFCVFWASYIVSAVLFFLVCIEIIRSSLSESSELQKLVAAIFRWAVFALGIISLSAINFKYLGLTYILPTFYKLMRSISIVELCLFVLLCLCMKALHLSVRDMAFGIILGFGVLSSGDLILSLQWTIHTAHGDPIEYLYEVMILSALGIWIAYGALPVQARNPMERAVDTLCL